MKKLFLLCTLFFTTALFAIPQTKEEKKIDQHNRYLKRKQLNLTIKLLWQHPSTKLFNKFALNLTLNVFIHLNKNFQALKSPIINQLIISYIMMHVRMQAKLFVKHLNLRHITSSF